MQICSGPHLIIKAHIYPRSTGLRLKIPPSSGQRLNYDWKLGMFYMEHP